MVDAPRDVTTTDTPPDAGDDAPPPFVCEFTSEDVSFKSHETTEGFGGYVAISDDAQTVVISEVVRGDSGIPERLQILTTTDDEEAWSRTLIDDPTDGRLLDRVGDLALSADGTLLAWAPSGTGQVFLYGRGDAEMWALLFSTRLENAFSEVTVALSEDNSALVIGSTHPPLIEVFRTHEDDWSVSASWTPPMANWMGGGFMAVDGSVERIAWTTNEGDLIVFTQGAEGWSEERRFPATESPHGGFRWKPALSRDGRRLFLRMLSEIRVWERGPAGWVETSPTRISGTDMFRADMGRELAISPGGDHVAIVDRLESCDGYAARRYHRQVDGTWTEEAMFRPRFFVPRMLENIQGTGTLAMAADGTILLGALNEGSDGLGVDGVRDNMLRPRSGAAYLFR